MATISHLPVSLALVHIPRSRLSQLSHQVLHQILLPSPAFLNITCNELELTIFAEHHMLNDFEPIARRDRQKRRSTKRNIVADTFEPIEVTYESWSVLQIDSHNDQMGNSGARVNELSAPLAEAGISILYQSSYMSDFIFVKETRLQEAMRLFASAGFDLYSSESNVLTSYAVSPPGSPLTDDRSSIAESAAFGTVLTRSRSSTDPAMPSTEAQEKVDHQSPRFKNKSHSPMTGQVDVLSPDLTCVGLSDDHVEHWTLKIIKLVAFPDLITTTVPDSSNRYDLKSSYDLYNTFPTPRPQKADIVSSSPPLSDSSSSTFSSDDEDGYFSHSPSRNLSSSSLVTSATSSKSFSDLTKLSGGRSHRQSISEGSISSRSSRSSHLRPSSKHLIQPMTPIMTFPTIASTENILGIGGTSLSANNTPTPSPHHTPAAEQPEQSPIVPAVKPFTRRRLLGRPQVSHKVPFFSFTRTPEGSSLTTSVDLLATLFPPSERHMVICGGELDVANERMTKRQRGGLEEEEPDGEDPANQDSTLKCLQIDLRKYGLDKHGLVNRFSRVLEDNGINHMYSATFKTANLLVDKKHARRAQALLRNC